MYPDYLSLAQIRREGEHAITGGGFADIWKGQFIGNPVALKAIRLFVNDSPEKKEKVLKVSQSLIHWMHVLNAFCRILPTKR